MHLVLFILKALFVAGAMALPQEIDNENLLNQEQLSQDQPYEDQSSARYLTSTVPAQDTSTSDDSGIQNYVAFHPGNLDTPSPTSQDTSSGDSLGGLTELAAVSNPMQDNFNGQNSVDRTPEEPQENFADISNLDASAMESYSDATLPYCDDVNKSEAPAGNLNNLNSREDGYLIAAYIKEPICDSSRGATCCSKKLQTDKTVKGCSDVWPVVGCRWGNAYCCKDVVNEKGIDCEEVPPQPTPTAPPPPGKKPKIPWHIPWPGQPEPAPAYQNTPGQACRARDRSPPLGLKPRQPFFISKPI